MPPDRQGRRFPLPSIDARATGWIAVRAREELTGPMCRNIRTLYNFEPPATPDEVAASAVQFVRKLSGFTRPSKANQAAFDRAVAQLTQAVQDLLDDLVTTAPPRDRAVEAAKARLRSAQRFTPVGKDGADG